MPLGNLLANKVLDHLTAKATWTAPAAIYVGFSSTTPNKTAGSITEPSGGAYARQQIAAGQWTSAATASTTTNSDETWTAASADWLAGVNLTHAVLWDHVTNTAEANYIGFVALTTPRSILNGETAKIVTGDIVFTLS